MPRLRSEVEAWKDAEDGLLTQCPGQNVWRHMSWADMSEDPNTDDVRDLMTADSRPYESGRTKLSNNKCIRCHC